MHKTWRLQGPGETCIIAPRSLVSQEEQAAYLSAQLDRWLADPLTRKTVLEVYEGVSGRSALQAKRLEGQELHRFVKSEILQAFRRGAFVLMRLPHVTTFPTLTAKHSAASADSQGAPPPTETSRKEDKKENTWVGVELVDQDGNPVPRARFVIHLADGTEKPGTLDDNGCGQVRDLAPGSYKVSFPDFDGSEWDAA